MIAVDDKEVIVDEYVGLTSPRGSYFVVIGSMPTAEAEGSLDGGTSSGASGEWPFAMA